MTDTMERHGENPGGNPASGRAPVALHNKILLALVGGAAAGIGAHTIFGSEALEGVVGYVADPVGRMWLGALIMVVIPLILSTLSIGVAGFGDMGKIGKVGAITMIAFMSMTILSTTLGLTTMNILEPGTGLSPDVKSSLMETYKGDVGAMGLSDSTFGIHVLINIIPRNPIQAMARGEMLAVIFFSLMIGIAMAALPKEKAAPMMSFLESLSSVTIKIIEFVMKLAPIGVFCLIFSITSRFGYDLLLNLLQYVLAVLGSMILFMVVVYPIMLKFVARRSPMEFFRKARIVLVTAFSTSSSNATLPTTMRVTNEELGVPREITSFVLPLGATMNMDGTALFEGATILFLAQVFGVELHLAEQLIVVLMSVVMSIGVAGVPGGSIPLLMMILAMVGVPMEGIAIILGVDRILDMCRTVLNVCGDMITTTIVQRFTETRT